MVHRRSGSILLVASLLLAIIGALLEISRDVQLFVRPSGSTLRRPDSSAIYRQAENKEEEPLYRDGKPRLSPGDDFVMPRNMEEEKKAKFWVSDFDRLSPEEKITSPWVVVALGVFTLPFIWGLVVIVNSQNANND
eukprot:TRINITY_DN39816_c0_g1_i1.p1 TRINITY_DN39816_c0_g1~~TRINITY_DN39816_c0_g1_i1.p1  ORF type:complete len:136 (+),score=24.29 TRINITY_DN39816_c0_g1_i1:46-453(+)